MAVLPVCPVPFSFYAERVMQRMKSSNNYVYDTGIKKPPRPVLPGAVNCMRKMQPTVTTYKPCCIGQERTAVKMWPEYYSAIRSGLTKYYYSSGSGLVTLNGLIKG
jgi:hypothetical protein